MKITKYIANTMITGCVMVVLVSAISNEATLVDVFVLEPTNSVFIAFSLAIFAILVAFVIDGIVLGVDCIRWIKFIDIIEEIKEKHYISASVTNKRNEPTRFYGVPQSIFVNGKKDPRILSYINRHGERISWSGGQSPDGSKLVDKSQSLNLVSITDNVLTFQMVSGEIKVEDAKHGKYKMIFFVKRQVENNKYRERKEIVEFEYFSEGVQNKIRLLQ